MRTSRLSYGTWTEPDQKYLEYLATGLLPSSQQAKAPVKANCLFCFTWTEVGQVCIKCGRMVRKVNKDGRPGTGVVRKADYMRNAESGKASVVEEVITGR